MTGAPSIAYDAIVFALQRTGGISRYFSELIPGVAAEAPVRVLEYRSEGTELPGVATVRPARRLLERYRSVPASALARANVFHSTYYRSCNARVARVVSVYDFVYERFPRGLATVVHREQKHAAIRGADVVLCISESTKRELFELLPSVAHDRVRVIHLGVGPQFSPGRQREAPPVTWPYAVFVGGRGGYKNFGAAVDAVGRVGGDLGLLIVGGGDLTSSEGRMLQQRLAGRYLHVGTVSDDALADLYRGAFCLLYPSLYEGFGLPVLEAMRAGCPVIAVARTSIPEVAGDAALLVENGSAEEIHDALVRLGASETRAVLEAAGVRNAERFSWPRAVAETLAVYREVS